MGIVFDTCSKTLSRLRLVRMVLSSFVSRSKSNNRLHRVSVQELKKHSLVALERPTFGIIAENTFNDSGVTY